MQVCAEFGMTLQLVPVDLVHERPSVAHSLQDGMLRHSTAVFLQGQIENDECLEAKEIEQPHLFSGKLDPQFVNALLKYVGIGPRKRRTALLKQFEKMHYLDLMGRFAGLQKLRHGTRIEVRAAKKHAPFFVH